MLEETGTASWQSPGAVDRSEWVNQIRTTSTITGPYQLQEDGHANYWGQLAMRDCLRPPTTAARCAAASACGRQRAQRAGRAGHGAAVESRHAMELGAHLPLIDFGPGPPSLAGLRAYTTRASELGYGWLCANDHERHARRLVVARRRVCRSRSARPPTARSGSPRSWRRRRRAHPRVAAGGRARAAGALLGGRRVLTSEHGGDAGDGQLFHPRVEYRCPPAYSPRVSSRSIDAGS